MFTRTICAVFTMSDFRLSVSLLLPLLVLPPVFALFVPPPAELFMLSKETFSSSES